MSDENFKRVGSSVTTPTNITKRKEVLVRMPVVILGIHSNVKADTGYTDGHAWLSVSRDGSLTFYGLWPDDHPMIVANGWDDTKASDIRTNIEKTQNAAASRYFRLSSTQVSTLEEKLKENVSWHYTNTCASWASDTYYVVTGEYVDADDYGGIETPRKVAASISELEATEVTSREQPTKRAAAKQSSSY